MRYRFWGITGHGDGNCGCITLPSASLAGRVEDRFRAGFRRLVVCSGDGPVPPRPDEDSVAEIAPHPETGHRTWWAETAEG